MYLWDKYLKSVNDTYVTKCDEVVIVMNNSSPKKTNNITTKVTRAASINCHSKKPEIAIFYIQFY